MFSILLPTWNNLEFLKLCVNSLHKNSSLPLQIIVHVNDGSDGSLQWVREQGLEHTHSPNNIGICHAVNLAASLAHYDNVVYLNDDMYCCPDWDRRLSEKIEELTTDLFMLSGTMIEPRGSGNTNESIDDTTSESATNDDQ